MLAAFSGCGCAYRRPAAAPGVEMPDQTKPKDLESVLAKLRKEWQELADLLTSRDMSQDRVMEVEKILLRDAAGQYRGKISVNPDGSADLLLSGRDGRAWVRLGVNEGGEAFLELKDREGASRFKVAPDAPSPGAGAGPADSPAGGPNTAASEPLEPPGAPSPPPGPAEAGDEPLSQAGLAPGPPAPGQDEAPGRDADAAVFECGERGEKLARQYRCLKWLVILSLGLSGVLLATQALVIFRPQLPGSAGESLVVRDPKGNLRVSLRGAGGKVGLDLWDAQGRRRAVLGLGTDGAPGLALYDQEQRVRAEVNLGPDGEPKLILRDQGGHEIHREAKPPEDSARQRPPGRTGPGAGAGVSPTPPAGPAAAVPPPGDAEPEVEFVGFKNSNKYHYPTCKWARTRYPAQLRKFKSAMEAQERGYIPCPVCKPPPLSP